MSTYYPVNGEITETYHPKFVTFTPISLVPNQSIFIEVNFFNENLVLLFKKSVKIEGEEYESWGDDIVFLNLLLNKLQISLVSQTI